MPNIEIAHEDPCPCGSGKVFLECCYKYGRLRPRHVKTVTSGPRTGYSHPGCYAASLNDCSKEISREHFITRSIIEFVHKYDGDTMVSGFPWQPIDKWSAPPNALASKILCKRHNSALSPLDNVGLRFFAATERMSPDNLGSYEVQRDHILAINGHAIERWILKTLIGLVYSENAEWKKEVVRGWKPDISWVKMLFGSSPFPKDMGLYIEKKEGIDPPTAIGFGIRPLFRDNRVMGAEIIIQHIKFILMLDERLRESKGITPERFIYHPGHIMIYKWDRLTKIELSWNEGLRREGVTLFKSRDDD